MNQYYRIAVPGFCAGRALPNGSAFEGHTFIHSRVQNIQVLALLPFPQFKSTFQHDILLSDKRTLVGVWQHHVFPALPVRTLFQDSTVSEDTEEIILDL